MRYAIFSYHSDRALELLFGNSVFWRASHGKSLVANRDNIVFLIKDRESYTVYIFSVRTCYRLEIVSHGIGNPIQHINTNININININKRV
jgi:hypothetical protein